MRTTRSEAGHQGSDVAHQCLKAELIDGAMLELATLPRGRFGLLDNLMRSPIELDAPPVVEGISVVRRPYPGEVTREQVTD